MAFAILVQGTANPEHVETLKTALLTLARESMQQPRTIRYDFFQSQDEPMKLFLIAMWEQEADWKAHVTSDVHDRYVRSLPQDAWAIRPQLTKLQPLADSN